MKRLSSIRWKSVERSRTPYYRLAEKEFNNALLKQLAPVIQYIEANGRIDDEILKMLIKGDPIQDTFNYVYTTAGVDFAQRQYNKFVTGEDLRKHFEIFMTDWVKKYSGEKITSITGVTRTEARKIISGILSENMGMAEGELGRLLARGIKEQGGKLAAWRSRIIARTEVATASNIGQFIGAKTAAEDAGVSMQKIWLATMDDRVRDAHFNMNGVAVEMNEPFTVNGEKMNTPGDPAGSPENVINCRCAVQYFIPKSRGI